MSWVLVGAAIAGPAVAAGALLVAYRNYRRGGARVSIEAVKNLHYPVFFVNGEIYDDVVSVRVSNRGLTAAQVIAISFDEGRARKSVPLSAGGPILPFSLAGLSDQEWTVPITDMLDPKFVTPGASARVRVRVQLGGRITRRSKWIQIRDEDFGALK